MGVNAIALLRERLSWSADPASAAVAGSALMARVGMYLFFAGGTLVLVSLAFPGGNERNELALVAIASAAYIIALFLLIAFERVPGRAFQALTATGTGLVSAALSFGGDTSSFYGLFYFWVALYAAYFFSWREAGLHIALVGLAYALVLALTDSGSVAPIAWLLTLATLTVIAALIIFLKQLEHARAELAAQNERLAELDRQKNEFVSLVSHELLTPLTSVRGYSSLLRDDLEALTPRHRAYVETIERNTRQLTRLVDDLLFFAQVDAGTLAFDPNVVDLSALTREAVEAARLTADQKGITLKVEACDGLLVYGDPARLGQVLDNLLSNAVKFTQREGHVGVEVASRDGRALIEVRDDGIGIPANERRHVFERFFRASTATERAIGGSGLGLTVARSIVEAHGGTITVESEEGAGTTFHVSLPLAEPAQVIDLPVPALGEAR